MFIACNKCAGSKSDDQNNYFFSVLNRKLCFLLCLKLIGLIHSIVCCPGWCLCQGINVRVKMSESRKT